MVLTGRSLNSPDPQQHMSSDHRCILAKHQPQLFHSLQLDSTFPQTPPHMLGMIMATMSRI